MKKSQSKIRKLRGSTNQQNFWKPVGVTQSGGSRYENGRTIPNAVQLLLYFRKERIITDEMLLKAQDHIKKYKLFK